MTTKGEIYAGISAERKDPVIVQQIRGVTATLIDNLEDLRSEEAHVNRAVSIAQTKYEEACMMAVKAYYLAFETEKE